ncbi:hypothetical protein A2Z23_01365 [Candidatus Curtissbacteria bacterium RBG_16_39_7]|uniref:Uncharacterized protein n=1 Tax=Candidatus Curtissbacteria bacterium RBG_16_39_7 TaxID=1797707 RepID=A0A1F5G2M7_9BACT|nr:MAG: hypothetical protein A2Z23_01365 [Candidatus Curtissbacteria bacterium RBG_16_39_7]
MKVKRSQFGFIVPLVLAVVGLGIVIVGVIVYSQLKTSTSKIRPTPTPAVSTKKATSSAQKEEMVSWRQFSGVLYDSLYDDSKNEGELHNFTFSYPANWKVTRDDLKNKGGHFYQIEGTNSFAIEVSEIPGGIGGACENTTPPQDLIVRSEQTTINEQSLYLTIIGSKIKQQVKEAYLDTDPNYYCIEGVVPVETKTKSINFVLSMKFPTIISADKFLGSEEYKTGKEILSTFRFE